MLKVFTGGAALSQDLGGGTKIVFLSQWIWNLAHFWPNSVGFTGVQCHSHFYSLSEMLNLRAGWLSHRIHPVSCCHCQNYFVMSQFHLVPHPNPVPVMFGVPKSQPAGFSWLWCCHIVLGQGSWEALPGNKAPRKREMQSLDWQVENLPGVSFPPI